MPHCQPQLQSLYHPVLHNTPVSLSAGTSFFMHFSTEGRNEGDAAKMESKTMTPKRDCKVQCLQFYYYHSGHESDQLNIWIWEYQNETDSRGTLRLMDQITGQSLSWFKYCVDLNNNSNNTCRPIFQARPQIFYITDSLITGSCIMCH